MKPYRVLITGSRNWTDTHAVRSALWHTLDDAPTHRPPIIVHGDCPTGADYIAAMWTRTFGHIFNATEEPHPADWDHCSPNCPIDPGHRRRKRPDYMAHPGLLETYCPAAGPRRNAAMVAAGADVCLAFIKNRSRGASHTARLAEQAGIPVRRWAA